ncbi:MAG: hypothetical protein NTW04_03375 [Elusimicrobia bacterium]|nr:hypothetical protein [Elusimicrobiota bacterium]
MTPTIFIDTVLAIVKVASLLGIVIFAARKLRISPETSFFMSVPSVIIALYGFGFAGFLEMGYFFIIIFGLSALIYEVALLRKFPEGANEIFTPGMVFFIVFIGAYYFLFSHRTIIGWDEFSYWASMSKEMLLKNTLRTALFSITNHAEIPPASNIAHYFFAKGLSKPEFFYRAAADFLLISQCMPFFSRVSWKKEWLTLPIAVGLMLIIHGLGMGLWTLYVDTLIGVIFGSVIYFYFCEIKKPNQIWRLIPSMILLPLIKDMGLFLALAAAAIFTADMILKYFSEKKLWRLIATTALLFLLPAISFLSWKIYRGHAGIDKEERQVSAKVFLASANAFTSQATSLQKEVVKNFGKEAVKQSAKNILLILLFLIAIRLPYNYARRKDILLSGGGLLFFYCVYIFFHLLLYLSVFSEYESARTASFGRYMSTYVAGMALAISAFFIPPGAHYEKPDPSPQPMIYFCMALLIIGAFKAAITPPIFINLRDSVTLPAAALIKKAAPENSRIQIIWQDSNGFEYYVFRYEILPRKSLPIWSLKRARVWDSNLNAEQYSNLLKENFDYVFLGRIDEYFSKTFAVLLPKEKFLVPALMKVTNKDGKYIKLEVVK